MEAPMYDRRPEKHDVSLYQQIFNIVARDPVSRVTSLANITLLRFVW